jgi:predicted nucleotidyltransferase
MMQGTCIDKQVVIERLRQREQELRAAGIVHLRVFGSVARDEASPVSDVDLLADFDNSRRMTLVKVGSLQGRLTKMLGVPVDLSSAEWRPEPVKSRALREAFLAF